MVKITDRSDNWINAGIFAINSQIFKYIRDNSTFFEHKPIQKLIKIKQINVFKHDGFGTYGYFER